MALNVSPEYIEADRQYRQAQTPAEKLAALEQMLRAIPKHKSSEKKQADLKRRISELKHTEKTPTKKGSTVDPYHIPPQGAGQVLLFGPPNSGKSSMVGYLTKAPVKITEFPYGTPLPVPGIAHHEDVPIELIDLPPVTPEHIPPGMINAIRNTDIIALTIDLNSPSVLEDLEGLLALLAERDVTFEDDAITEDPTSDNQRNHLQTGPQGLIVCNKVDLPGTAETLAVLKDLCPSPLPTFAVSAQTGEGLADLMRTIFEMLDVIRIYSKEPGKPPDRHKPFVLPAGSTIGELARTIHKDLANKLKFARIWGEDVFAGQQVHSQHVLHDRDTVELHE